MSDRAAPPLARLRPPLRGWYIVGCLTLWVPLALGAWALARWWPAS